MKSLIGCSALALLALLGRPDRAAAQDIHQCQQNPAIYDASSSGDTQMIAAVAGQSIYICGYVISTTQTVNAGFDAGTGTNCGSNTTKETPYWEFANGGLADRTESWQGFKLPPGYALCLNSSGASAVQAMVYWTRF